MPTARKFGRVYTDKDKATRFADRQKRSPVVKSARITPGFLASLQCFAGDHSDYLESRRAAALVAAWSSMLYKEESLSGLSIVVVRNLAKVQVSVRFR